jgi:hypothetical protein
MFCFWNCSHGMVYFIFGAVLKNKTYHTMRTPPKPKHTIPWEHLQKQNIPYHENSFKNKTYHTMRTAPKTKHT